MNWLKKTSKKWGRKLWCKLSDNVIVISNGFIINVAYGEGDSLGLAQESQNKKVGEYVLETIDRPHGENVIFTISRESMLSIVKARASYYTFTVHRDISSIDTCIVVQYDHQKRMSIIAPCVTEHMTLWQPEIEVKNDK